MTHPLALPQEPSVASSSLLTRRPCRVDRHGSWVSDWGRAWLERICAASITAETWGLEGQSHPCSAVGALASAVVFYRLGSGLSNRRGAARIAPVPPDRHELYPCHDMGVQQHKREPLSGYSVPLSR